MLLSVFFLYLIQQGVKFKRPSAIVCDSQDNIYVKDDFGVQIFDVNGKKIKSFGQFQRPFGKYPHIENS